MTRSWTARHGEREKKKQTVMGYKTDREEINSSARELDTERWRGNKKKSDRLQD